MNTPTNGRNNKRTVVAGRSLKSKGIVKNELR
jgi:hypothetical protein